jgi:hypothetical protein
MAIVGVSASGKKFGNVARDAAAAGIRHVWLQQGAQSPEIVALCDQLGLETVAGECILMFAKPTGVHRSIAGCAT